MPARRVLGRAAVLAAVAPLVLIWSAPAAAQQPADPPTVNACIDRGTKWLQKQQKPAGWWGTGNKMQEAHGIGYTCLVGLTLVECGVPTTDAKLKQAAALVRSLSHEIETTYELALAILFLDRMKDRVDKRVIQLLAGRLISAQMPSGGWGYKAQKYPEPSVLQLLAALRKLQNPPAEGPKPDPDKLRQTVPADMRRLAIWDNAPGQLPADPPEKRWDLHAATTDNSNTHFAMLGLLAAREYEIPVERSFALVAQRFRTSQGPSGTWTYDFVPSGANGANQYTCIGLIGVAIGHVYSPPAGVKPEADPIIINAFTALSRSIGEPVGDTNNRPKVKDVGGMYFLWAMERIAVLYDIQKLGKKDWYMWGAEILVCAQAANGSWDEEGGYHGQHPILNTCFALLFLKRANLTPGLSKRLTVDTGVLTAKVDDQIKPKVEPPPPSPKEEPPPPPEEPPPTPKEEPKPAPQATPVVQSAPAPEPEPAPPPKKKSPVVWIVLGVLLAAIVGGGLAFLVVKRKNQESDDAAAKPKKKKKKVKTESGEANVSNAETAKKPNTKPKVKQDVELDDD